MSNIELLTMMNLYQNGFINNKGENLSMTFETLNRDYTIELTRKNTILWNNENSFRYQCEFIFKNICDIEVLRIIVNEEDIMKLIDSVYSYIEFGMSDVYIFLNSYSINSDDYIFSFKNIENKIFFAIEYYNKFYDMKLPKLNIEFNDKKLNEFLEKLYYTFLIDIDTEDSLLLNPDFLC